MPQYFQAWISCAALAIATLSVAHLLDCSEGRLQRSVVVDVEVVGKGCERAGLVKNDLAVAGEAIKWHLTAQSFGNRCLAGSEKRPSYLPCLRRAPTGLHTCRRSW